MNSEQAEAHLRELLHGSNVDPAEIQPDACGHAAVILNNAEKRMGHTPGDFLARRIALSAVIRLGEIEGALYGDQDRPETIDLTEFDRPGKVESLEEKADRTVKSVLWVFLGVLAVTHVLAFVLGWALTR